MKKLLIMLLALMMLPFAQAEEAAAPILEVHQLPIGYADGFMRGYSGASVRIETALGEVLAPIIGRICMDQCMVDVTDLPVSVGDRVTLFGVSPDDIRDLARRGGTIPYEVLCLISARVPRRYI